MCKISVIIPTYKRNDLLSKCLDKLHPNIQTINSLLYEVIVTDDSLAFDAKELIEKKYPWAKWIEGPHKGPAANRNNGAKHSKGEWLIFIDDDCIPDQNILMEYLNEIHAGVHNAIEGYINADRPKQRFDEESPINTNGGCFWSCNIAIERNLFDKLKGFDDKFPYAAMEDVDLHNRIKQIGSPVFLEKAKVIHPWRRVKPFHSYKKWIASNRYILQKNNINKNFKYRTKRINLFLGLLYSNTIRLYKYSFRGIGGYLENIWFHFLMIFL